MIPIYEQMEGHGHGHSFETFLKRFREICFEHIKNKRAKAFAILFYDFQNDNFKKLLKQNNVFTELDRLSGKDLSVFYLHSSSKEEKIDEFNTIFQEVFDVKEKLELPFVLFLKFDPAINEITDLRAVVLEKHDIILSFNELYKTLGDYIGELNKEGNTDEKSVSKGINLLQTIKKIGIERFIKTIFDKVFEQFFN